MFEFKVKSAKVSAVLPYIPVDSHSVLKVNYQEKHSYYLQIADYNTNEHHFREQRGFYIALYDFKNISEEFNGTPYSKTNMSKVNNDQQIIAPVSIKYQENHFIVTEVNYFSS